MAVSEQQIQTLKQEVESCKSSVSDAGNSFTASSALINETIGALSVCWNTVGGEEKQARLRAISEAELDPSKVVRTLSEMEGITVTAEQVQEDRTSVTAA